MELLLTDKEGGLLNEVLQEHQKHLLLEIARADHHAYKDSLRQRYSLLEGILEKLSIPVR